MAGLFCLYAYRFSVCIKFLSWQEEMQHGLILLKRYAFGAGN